MSTRLASGLRCARRRAAHCRSCVRAVSSPAALVLLLGLVGAEVPAVLKAVGGEGGVGVAGEVGGAPQDRAGMSTCVDGCVMCVHDVCVCVRARARARACGVWRGTQA